MKKIAAGSSVMMCNIKGNELQDNAIAVAVVENCRNEASLGTH